MFNKYDTLKSQSKFSWSVTGNCDALREMSGISFKEFNLNPKAAIHMYKTYRPKFQEMFGPDVLLPSIVTPPISYGHVNALGSELIFPEDGEVSQKHIYSSLDEAIRRLKCDVDFYTAGQVQTFINFKDELQKAFPDEKIGFSWGNEGHVTTAYLLRGDDFFADILEEPEKTHEFFHYILKSLGEYWKFYTDVTNQPVKSKSGGMCDDIASLIPPYLWDEFVLPYWDEYYKIRCVDNAIRYIHVEELKVEQLKFLEKVGIDYFDPSVSTLLTPDIIDQNCPIPFGWRLVNFHLRDMSVADVSDFVYLAAAGGASKVFTYVVSGMLDNESVKKINAFIIAAKQTQSMFEAGATRQDIRATASEEGRKKFWKHWTGYKG